MARPLARSNASAGFGNPDNRAVHVVPSGNSKCTARGSVVTVAGTVSLLLVVEFGCDFRHFIRRVR